MRYEKCDNFSSIGAYCYESGTRAATNVNALLHLPHIEYVHPMLLWREIMKQINIVSFSNDVRLKINYMRIESLKETGQKTIIKVLQVDYFFFRLAVAMSLIWMRWCDCYLSIQCDIVYNLVQFEKLYAIFFFFIKVLYLKRMEMHWANRTLVFHKDCHRCLYPIQINYKRKKERKESEKQMCEKNDWECHK